MVVLSNSGGLAMTNCYLIADETTKKAVLFDAPDHTVEPLLDAAEKRGWDLIGLWLTHGHFDHFADHPAVHLRFPKAKVLLHQLEESKVTRPDVQTGMFGIPLVIPSLKVDEYVTDNERLKLGSLEVLVLHTPGHAPGHVCYYFPRENVLVGGDLIIGGSIGRTDLPDSDHRRMEASLRKIMTLPPETKLLGGHGPLSTLADERRHNAFLQELFAA
jgi:glyoxylase-like metal-dependent hydrolase (beta-lactamase superfamily II)